MQIKIIETQRAGYWLRYQGPSIYSAQHGFKPTLFSYLPNLATLYYNLCLLNTSQADTF